VAVPAPRLARAPGRRPAVRAVPGRPVRRQPAGRHRLPFLLLATIIVTGMVVGLVSAQTLVAQGSFRLQELSERADRLEAGFGRLRLRADRLSSLDRIERAGRRAGLKPAARLYFLTVPQRADDTPAPDPAAQADAAIGAGG
jgi:cell division protein FtsL